MQYYTGEGACQQSRMCNPHIEGADAGTDHNPAIQALPKHMKIEFVYFIVLWLNAFPVKTGILALYLPREILV
jgi:hypothetical protein